MGRRKDKGQMSQEVRDKISESHKKIKHNWYTRKGTMDAQALMDNYPLWVSCSITMTELAKRVGYKTPTSMSDKIARLRREGFLPGQMFSDGKPMYATFENLAHLGLPKTTLMNLTREKPDVIQGAKAFEPKSEYDY